MCVQKWVGEGKKNTNTSTSSPSPSPSLPLSLPSLPLSVSPSFSFPLSLFPLSLSLSPSAKAGGDREVKTVNRAGLWRVGGRTLSGFGGQNTLQAAIRDSVSAVTLCVCFVCTCCPPTSVLTVITH